MIMGMTYIDLNDFRFENMDANFIRTIVSFIVTLFIIYLLLNN